MRNKIYNFLNKTYGLIMSIAFWGGIIPLIPFVFAILVGGELGENIAVICYEYYYPWIIALASIAVIIGLIAMYVGKQDALSSKSLGRKN